MNYAIVCAVLGVLIGAVTIGIPRLIADRKNHPEDQADSRAYMKETGRSAQDIAQGNAALRSRQQDGARSQQASGSGGPASHADASSRETSQR
jgi:hypothetical protein